MEALFAAFASEATAATLAAGAAEVTAIAGTTAGAGIIGSQALGVTAGSSFFGALGVGTGQSGGFGLLSSAFSSFGKDDNALFGLTGFSAISNLRAGSLQASALREAALFESFGAKQEILRGKRDALEILIAENDSLEQNIVSTAASGLTGEGSAKAAQLSIIRKAAFETGVTKDTALINAGARRTRGRQLNLDADAAKVSGAAAAAGDFAGFFLRRRRRG